MRLRVMVAVAAGLALAGCGASTAGTPGPASSSAAPRLSPPIPRPLDASGYTSHPCDLVKPAQLAALGISHPGERDDVATGPSCRWEPDNFDNISYDVVIDTGALGLESLYQRRETFQVFEPVMVAGYPAIHEDHYDERSQGSCQVLVGIHETTTIDVINHVRADSSPDYTNSCRTTDAFAAMVIHNLGG